MIGASRTERLREADIEQRLEQAGRVLLALPWAGCFPCGFRGCWPELAGETQKRRRTLSPQEITAMDEAYSWTTMILDQDERRLVLMRSLVLEPTPFGTPRYVWSWRRLRQSLGMHPDTLKKLHGRGISRIVRGLNETHRRRPIVERRPASIGQRLFAMT